MAAAAACTTVYATFNTFGNTDALTTNKQFKFICMIIVHLYIMRTFFFSGETKIFARKLKLKLFPKMVMNHVGILLFYCETLPVFTTSFAGSFNEKITSSSARNVYTACYRYVGLDF